MSERVFYPDTDDVSSTSKVVALSIARNRTCELILSASTIQFAPDESAVADASTNHAAVARIAPKDVRQNEITVHVNLNLTFEQGLG
jgi:hypothetical protein